MPNKRDDFTPKTIQTLRIRVNGICSKPGCHKSCVAPKENDPVGVEIVGVAAHICAASKGGPRFDKNMTPQERKSISNGIWLCEIHAKEIDISDNGNYKYTKEELLNWKKQAENKTRKLLGEKIPSEEDAVNLLKATFTGESPSFLANAIHNVCSASDSALEKLDPRFSVVSTYDGNNITTELSALEPVEVVLKIKPEFSAEYSRKMTKFTNHGKALEIDASGISFEGSKLLEEILNGSGTFSILKEKKKIKQKIWITDPKTNIVDQFDDLEGEVVAGTKTFTMVASNCNDLIKTTLEGKFSKNSKLKMSINLNTKRWEKLDIRELPFFDKIYEFYNKINKGWLISTSIEYEGKQTLKTSGIRLGESKLFCPVMSFLHYTNYCRVIVNKIPHPVFYTNDISFTAEEFNNIKYIAKIVEGKIQFNNETRVNDSIAKVSITLSTEIDIDYIQEVKTIKIEEPQEDIKLFETTIILPSKVYYFSNIKAEITSPKNSYTKGDKINVIIMPDENLHSLVTLAME